MATYAEHAAARERETQRASMDRRLAARHAYFDAAAGEVRMKYERAHFAVVGEGTRTAQENYRDGWDRVFASQATAPAK